MERRCAHAGSPHDPRGFSLVELLVVVAILAIGAGVALPTFAPSRGYALDRAAHELAAALRFARGQALRSARPHGVRLNPAELRVRVALIDLGTAPPTPLYEVHHPLTKRRYDVQLRERVSDAALVPHASWRGSCDTPELVGFDAHGTPRCGDPWATTLDRLTLELRAGGVRREVRLDGETGRVSVR